MYHLAVYRKSLLILVLEMKNVIFKVDFSLDEINNSLNNAEKR